MGINDKQIGKNKLPIREVYRTEYTNISVSFEHILKERRIMATGYMHKLIEMKERVREFNYKWENIVDKSQPLMWEVGGPGGGSKKLC